MKSKTHYYTILVKTSIQDQIILFYHFLDHNKLISQFFTKITMKNIQ